MDIASGIVVYICVWWMILFMTLPFGVRLDENGPEISGPGAPADPGLKKKVIVTSLISLVIWVIIYFLIQAEFMDFRGTARAMAEKDYQ